MSGKDIQFLFTLRNQIKLYHWQTISYSRHKATDVAVDTLDEHIDKYVEVYMGKYGRAKLRGNQGNITVKNLSETQIVGFIKAAAKHLTTGFVVSLDKTDTDLFNIRDEMLGDLHQLLYLFSLR
jgi:hypothetical protein